MNLGEILAGGQERRKKLDQTLGETLNYYLGPTGIPQRLAALGVLNPVNDMEQASQKAKTVFSPDATGRERFDAGVGMVTDMATVLAPAAATNRVGGDATSAVVDSLLGIGSTTREGLQDAGRRFAGDEAGNISFGASKADEIARLLREGRADEITDDMMAALDPNDQMRLFKLYEDGATGMPMPMDTASRMARARDMGFDTDLYHGSEFDLKAVNSFDGRAEGGQSGLFSSDEKSVANTYARPRSFGASGGQVIPLRADTSNYRQAGYTAPFPDSGTDAEINKWLSGLDDYNQRMARDGVKSAVFNQQVGLAKAGNNSGVVFRQTIDDRIDTGRAFPSDVHVTLDPTTIRSRFARFDPRLKHLANLSAAGAGAVPLGALLANYDQDAERRKLRDYLQQ